ncbi:tetratricopeptide repeat protein [Pseudoxanthomonas sp. 10H]|uniref:tetratricopeptide repeat protein n=1 Tax=Pseudoxanthomonas sp. 10H TaxID=3242729 RepID=UPI00355646B5
MLTSWTLVAALALAPAPQEATATAPVPTAQEVMAVPEALRTEVRERVRSPGSTRGEQLERLATYVFDEGGLVLQYDNETTRTVAEVYRDRKANCLSFTLLFVALAREVGLEAQVQEVGEVLAWYQDEGVIYSANHVNVGVRTAVQWQVVDVDSNIIAARNRPSGIDDHRAMAHFYNNRGAEAMAAGDLDAAQALLAASLSEAPGFVPAWNNLGVLKMRLDDAGGAEEAYLTALRRQRNHAPTMMNLVTLYRRTGDERMVRSFQRRLDNVQRSDPFHQFMLALECENNGDYDCAIGRYKRAIRLQGDEHQFHFGLARVYFLSGNLELAQRELGRAHTLGDTDHVRAIYRKKLDGLRRWREQASSQFDP